MKFSVAIITLASSLLAAASPVDLDLAALRGESHAAIVARATTTTAKTTTTTAIPVPTDYSTVAVNQHNIHRANHSAPAVTWNADLASYAATVASSCVFAHNLTPGASTGSYGQNIAAYGSTGNIAAISADTWISVAITDQWYNAELPYYPSADYGLPTPSMTNFGSWGHFSQIVWASTTQIGCASHYCPAGTIFSNMGSWFSVCDYRAVGNVASQYGKNVLPPLGKATVVVGI